MLPATFDNDNQLRVSQAAIGIVAVASLTAGFSLTGLLCFAVRNPTFQAESVFLPALSSCAIGLLTVLYDFLISQRYSWNTAALLVTIAGALSTVVYGVLLIWTHRRIAALRPPTANFPAQTPLGRASSINSSSALWQDPGYYENYVRNMYPTSAHPANSPQQPLSGGYDPASITEEEMQRQQMLMLLLHKPPSPPVGSVSNSHTYNIDWQGREEDDLAAAPPHGFYAPGQPSPAPSSEYTPRPEMVRQLTHDLRPWDGVWRGPGPPPASAATVRHPRQRTSTDPRTRAGSREERRREIELGR